MSNNQVDKITFQGSPMQLVGRRLALNTHAPNFLLVNNAMEEVDFSKFKGKIKVITSLPSLDTPVCELQAKRFNKSAAALSDNIVVMVVSKDLPFAQKRFCIDHDINNLMVLSDYKYSSFGVNYGLLIKDLNLLARAVVILDSSDVVRYIQIGAELTDPLDYEDALTHLTTINTQTPSKPKVSPVVCKSCSVGMPLSIEIVQNRLSSLTGWCLVDDKKITKEITFTSYSLAKYFLDLIVLIAEEQKHHPTLILSFNKLKIVLSTHAADGLTENDFVIAQMVDELIPLS